MNLNAYHSWRYADLWMTMQITSNSNPRLHTVERLMANEPHYKAAQDATGIPWWHIGAIHSLECDCDMNGNILNGEPLDQVTVAWPPGHGPWATWPDMALEVLSDYVELTLGVFPDGMSIQDALFFAEGWNGMGYQNQHPGVQSPYLWGGSQHYVRGKYSRDGHWDCNARSLQVGAAVLWKTMIAKGYMAEPPIAIKEQDPISRAQVCAVQRYLLDLKVDGDAGPKTRAAYLKRFGVEWGAV
jgi:lysozyme family protein